MLQQRVVEPRKSGDSGERCYPLALVAAARYGTTFFVHVKHIGGGAPAGSSIKLVKDPAPFTIAKPVPFSQSCSAGPPLAT